jgi:hypothetical protein
MGGKISIPLTDFRMEICTSAVRLMSPRSGVSQSKTTLFGWRSSAGKSLLFNADISNER